LILINHEITYDTGMLGHLCPRCPTFQRAVGSAPVMHPCSGVPACNQQQKTAAFNLLKHTAYSQFLLKNNLSHEQ